MRKKYGVSQQLLRWLLAVVCLYRIPFGQRNNPRTHIGCDYLHPQASKLAYHFNPRTIVGQDVVCPHFLVPLFNPRTLRVKGYDTLNSYRHSVRFNPCIPVLLCY